MNRFKGSTLLRLTILLTAILIGHSNLVSAQAVRLPAEQRVSDMRFFAVHNAFQRSWPEESVWLGQENQITVAQQLDRYNVWHQEIDIIRWNNIYFTAHHCADDRGFGQLFDAFNAMIGTQRFKDGFFIVGLSDNGGNYPDLCPVAADNYSEATFKSEVNAIVNAYFDSGSGRVYTPADWENDGKQWPSPQELIRRGKRVAFYFGAGQGFGLVHGQGFPDSPIKKASAENSLTPPAEIKGAYYTYPADASEDDEDWNTAMANGFNFVGTTKMGLHWNDTRFHPPLPMYIRNHAANGPSVATGRGTYSEPYYANTPAKSFMAALTRIQAFQNHGTTSIIRLNMPPGDYNMTGGTSSLMIDEAILINPDHDGVVGTIVIR